MRAGNKPHEVELSPCDLIQSLSLLVQNSDLDPGGGGVCL